MAKNWYTRLLKNIIGRTSNDVSSKSELRLKRLEDRRLLNADFALAGGVLDLTAFDGTDVVIADTGADITFTLDVGDTWNNVGAVDPNAMDAANVLTVSKAAFAAGGTIDINDMANGNDVGVTINDVDFVVAGANNINLIIDNAGNVSDGVADEVTIDGTVSMTNVGDVSLNNATNDFQSTVTVANAGTVTIQDANALTIGGITTDTADDDTPVVADMNDVTVTAGGDLIISGAIDTTGAAAGDVGDDNITLTTTSGTITVNAALNAGNAAGIDTGDVIIDSASTITLNANVTGDNVRLDAEGTISQTGGIITAESLSALQDSAAAGSITLLQANNVDLFAADNDFATGGIALRSTVDLSLGTVNTIMGVTTDNGTIDLQSDTILTVTDALIVNTNDGDVFLHGGTDVNLTGALDVGAGDLVISDGNALDVDQILTSTGTIFLQANGDITQSAVINAGTLAVQQQSIAAGTITLTGDNVVNNFAASNTFDTGAISFNNTQSLAIVSVPMLAGAGVRPAFTATSGVTSDDGAITITTDDGAATNTANINVNGLINSTDGTASANDGMITLNADGTLTLDGDGSFDGLVAGTAINAGMGAVMLTSNGSMTQDTDGLITAASVNATQAATAGGNITLGENNSVAAFTASNTADAGTITFNSDQTLSVGAVTSDDGAINITTNDGAATNTANINVNGVINSTDGTASANDGMITLNADGTLALNLNNAVGGAAATVINSGMGAVMLTSNGNMTQDTDGLITAASVNATQSLDAAGNVAIALGGNNSVAAFTASNADDAGTITFNSNQTLSVGAVTSDDGAISITTDDGAATNTANINVNGLINSTDGTPSVTDGMITLNADGTLTLDVDGSFDGLVAGTAINAGMGAVMLTSNGSMTQDTDGLITAASVNATQAATAAGNIALGENNSVAAFTASNTADAGTITFNSDQTLSVGAVSSDDGAISITTDDGAATNTANINVNGLINSTDGTPSVTDGMITLNADGTLTLDADGSFDGLVAGTAINSGMAVTRLVANGSITQDTDGLITAATLGVRQNSATAGFNINLCEANVVGTFAANNASDGFISFQSTQSFTTGSVPAVTGFAITNGVTTTGGNIELQSGGTLTIAAASPVNANGGNVSLLGATDVVLNAAMNTGAGDLLIVDGGALTINQDLTSMGTIRLQASGAITQTNESIITADELGVRQVTAGANIDIILTAISGTNELNAVNEFAAQNLSVGGQVEFLSENSLTVGGVTAGTGKGAVFTAVNGVTTTAFVGQTASFTDTSDRGDILIETRGSLTLAVDDLIDGMTGVAGQTTAISAAGGLSDVRLVADGAIAQDQDGLIVADELGVRLQSAVNAAANENVSLGFGNSVNEVAILNTSSEGNIVFQNSQTLSVGAVAEQMAPNTNVGFAATTGVLTDDGDITIRTNDGAATNTANINVNALVTSIGAAADGDDGTILISADGTMTLDLDRSFDGLVAGTAVNSGDAVTRLVSNGSMTQDSDGLITADTLGVRQNSTVAGANINLCEANVIDNIFAANNASTTGFISFQSTQSFTTGSVSAVTDFAITNGVTTQGGNIELQSGGTLTIAAASPVNANGGDVSLLGGTDVVLNAALNTGAGDILIVDGGALSINQDLTSMNSIRLQANGAVTQTAGSIISAGELGVRQTAAGANININLSEDNTVSQFAATNASVGGQIEFLTLNDLTIGNVTAGSGKGVVFTAVNGVTTTAFVGQTANLTDISDRGDILIETRGSLTLAVDETVDGMTGIVGQVNAISAAGGMSDARLIADEAITQDSDGLIVADELGVRLQSDVGAAVANENIGLGFSNAVNEVAILNTSVGGTVTFQSVNNLAVGVVAEQNTPNTDIDFTLTTGVLSTNSMTNTNNNILIEAGGFLNLDEAVNTDATGTTFDADVRLIANGDIAQDAEGVITANELGVLQRQVTHDNAEDIGMDDSQHDVDLGFNNNVDEVAINNAEAGAEINFQSVRNLTVGSVAAVEVQGIDFESPTTADNPVTGVISTSAAGNTTNDITIEADGFLNLDEAVSTDRNATNLKADVRLLASGDVFQDSQGIITANELGVIQRRTPHVVANNIAAAGADTDHDVDLGEANDVDEVAINNAEVGAEVNFRSIQNLTVGSVAAKEVPGIDFELTMMGNDPVVGIVSTSSMADTTNEITIQADGSLNLDETVNTDRNSSGFVSDVRLIGNGDIAQDAEGIIVADELGVLQSRATHATANDIVGSDTQHDVDLGFNNQVNEVAIRNVEAGAEINFHSVNNLVVGTVDDKLAQTIDFQAPAPAPADTNVIGVVSADGDILIQAGNPDSTPLVMPFVDDNPASLTLDLNNTFDATGSGTAVNSGTANTRLVAFGDIRQDSDGLITANSLGVRQNSNDIPPAMGMAVAGDADIDDNSAFNIDLGYVNSVTTFAAFNAYDANLNANDTQGGIITFQNDDTLAVGTVSAPATAIGTTLFANTTGIATTYTGAAVASRDADGDGTFEVTDVLAGDILIDNEGAIAVNSGINAGSGNSDVRLAADGAITQTAIITANELNVRLDTATANTDITLTMMNMVDEFAAFNQSSEGDISFTDAENLNINVLTSQDMLAGTAAGYAAFTTNGTRFDMNAAPMMQPVANVAIGASGGDIAIAAGGNLTVIGVTDALTPRFIYSTDGTVDSSTATDGESIALTANGNITIEMNTIVTTDENTAVGVSAVDPTDQTLRATNDQITIQADANDDSVDPTTDGLVMIEEGVVVRSDGGVAIAFASRPLSPDSAFFLGAGNSYPIEASTGPQDGVGLSSEAAFTVRVGVTGEENLRVNVNWDDPIGTDVDIASSFDTFDDLLSNGVDQSGVGVDSQRTLENFLAQTGGNDFQFGHVYTQQDLILIAQNQGQVANVTFGVSQNESIVVQGNRISQSGFAQTVSDGNISETSDNIPGNGGELAGMNGDNRFENGTAIFRFGAPRFPFVPEPDLAPEPNPAPPNPEPVQVVVPLTVVNVEPAVASRVGVSSQSFDYFQLRRNEGEAGYEIIDEQISEDNGESLLDPRTLKQYVDDNNIPDEQDYELWLITTKVNNAGQSVTLERPILKFDVSGGRPIPAIEDLPMEFPELRLEPIPLDGDAEVEPVENSDLNEVDPKGDKQEVPEKVEEEQDAVSLLDETDQIQRIDGSHQASAIGVGSVLAVSNLNRKKSSIEGRRVRNASLLSRIFGGKSSN